MIDGKFTAKERAYLASLPAVKSVSPSHIRYTDRFKVEVMCRYNAGESPSAIFREAGLDPKLIGYKRVERCIARWKQQEERNKRRNEHTNHYMQDCDDELEAIELRGDDVDQSVVDLYGAGAAGTSGSDVATRNVGASGSNGVQSQGSDKLQESRASQDMLSKLAQAQLTINKLRHADSQAGVAYRRAGTRAAEVHPVMRAKRMKNMERTEGAEPSFNEIIDVSDDMRRRRGRRRKTVAMRVSAALLIVISICIGGFPAMLQYRSAHELSNTSDQSARAVAGWPYPQADDAIAAAKEYNKRLAASGQPILGEAKDPFSQAQGSSRSSESGSNESDSASAKDTEYQSLLDSGSGVMGTIRIPKISVKLPIYHGTSQSALASGAGHLYGSSLPVGGKNTHAVITGHRGLVDAMMFTRLDEMRVGDYFYIEVMGRTLGYRVDRISVIEPNDTSKLKIVPSEDRVTLMACTPYGVNTHRLLVSAVRSPIPDVVPAEHDAAKDARTIATTAAVVTLLLGLLLAWLRGRPWHIRRHAAWWPKRG